MIPERPAAPFGNPAAGPPAEGERRASQRTLLHISKIFRAAVEMDGGSHLCFLYLMDVSEGGMKITSDFHFPERVVLPLTLQLQEPVTFHAQVAWQKELLGGTSVVGLKFALIEGGELEKIRTFLDLYSPAGRRKSFRLNRVLTVEMDLPSLAQRMFPLTIDLSADGMRITHEQAIPEDMDLPFKIFLEGDQPPVEVTARVAWQKETSFGAYMIGLVFTAIAAESAARIEHFIDRAMAGEIDESDLTPPRVGMDDLLGPTP